MITHNRISVLRIEEAFRKIDPLFLHTPQYSHETMSAIFDADVILKVETLNPIRSFKGRGADFLVSQAGTKEEIVCASAGNFGQAMAFACRKRAIELTVFASIHANPFKVQRMQQLGARVMLSGDDFDSAKLAAKQMAINVGARFVEDSLDVETVEGAGTIGLELLSITQPIDILLIAMGNGALINGIGKVFKERRPQTKIIAVQAAGAPAMVESWRTGSLVTFTEVNTIADGIAVRIPVPQALVDMDGIVDDALLVNEDSIIEAIKLIHTHAGIVSEPSGAVGIAALLENSKTFAGKTIATVVCGGNVTTEQWQSWI